MISAVTASSSRDVARAAARTLHAGQYFLDIKLPDYLVSRVAEHSRRRAAQMREVAQTLTEIGVEPLMATATAERQQHMVDLMAATDVSYRRDEPFCWRVLVDALAEQRTRGQP